MSQGLRFLRSAARSERRHTKSTQSTLGQLGYSRRRLAVEPLEDRNLLSTSVSGVIFANTIWYAANRTYNLTGSVYVEEGATLTIQPGVQVQGSALYIDDDGSGGSLSASGVSFQNSRVELDKGAAASLSGDQFLNSNAYVDATLAGSLSGNTFPANSTVSVLYGTLETSATFPFISNVSNYALSTLYIESGATLTIANQNTITGSGLYVNDNNSGGSLSASGVTFQNSRVELDKGASVSLSGDKFLSNNVYVDATLASSLSGNTFPANSTVSVLYGTLETSATFPLISNVSNYSLSTLYIESGATLTIANQNTITGSGLYVNDNNSGGSLSASSVTFQNSRVELDKGASVALSADKFLSNNVYVDATLASSLSGNTFPANSTASVLYGTLKTSATFPLISNVSNYALSTLYIESGATLTIANQNTITGSGLYVNDNNSGGSLSASGVTFQNSRVELDKGASVSLSGDKFLSNNVYVDATLASSLSGNTFPANSTVSVLYGTLETSATFPLISNVSNYSLSTLYIESGATLTIANQNTITGSGLYVSDDGSGGILMAEGVTFSNQVSFGPASQGLIEFDKFTYSGYNYFDGQMLATVTDDDFSASEATPKARAGRFAFRATGGEAPMKRWSGRTRFWINRRSRTCPLLTSIRC